MRYYATKYLINLFIVAASSFLLVLSFPEFDLGILAWVGLVPLFVAITGEKEIYGFILAIIGGIFYFLGVFSGYWRLTVTPCFTTLFWQFIWDRILDFLG